jgi:hypothetical protein
MTGCLTSVSSFIRWWDNPLITRYNSAPVIVLRVLQSLIQSGECRCEMQDGQLIGTSSQSSGIATDSGGEAMSHDEGQER